MNVIARAVALVEMAIAAQMQQIELVNQAVALEQINRAVNGDARDIGIDLLGAIQDFTRVQMAAGSFHHLHENSPLPRQSNAARGELPREMAGRLIGVDSFSGGNAVC